MAGWNFPILKRKYIFNPGPCSIAMLVYRSVIDINGRQPLVIKTITIGCINGCLVTTPPEI